jgi:hypothetical protein
MKLAGREMFLLPPGPQLTRWIEPFVLSSFRCRKFPCFRGFLAFALVFPPSSFPTRLRLPSPRIRVEGHFGPE